MNARPIVTISLSKPVSLGRADTFELKRMGYTKKPRFA
jgi:hypothetical protein